MMRDTICLVTGLQLEYDGRFFWGDLHKHPSGALIFNAVCKDGEAVSMARRPEQWRSIACAQIGVWERRGVFVLERELCTFNTVLRRYLEESPHAR